MHQKTLSDIFDDPRRREPCALKQGGIREQGKWEEGSISCLYRVVMIQAAISSSIPQCQWREGKKQRRREALGNTPLSLFALLPPLSLFCLTQFVSATLPTEGGEVPLLDPNIFCRWCVGVFFCETVCAGLPCLLQ